MTTALAQLPPDTELASARTQAATLVGAASTLAEQACAAARTITVVDANTNEVAVTWIRQIKQVRKALETERKTLTKPLADALEAMRSWWRAPLKRYEEAEQHLRDQCNAFEARRHAELTASLTAATSTTEIQQSVQALATPAEKTHTREEWRWEIADVSKIPYEYFVLDTARLDRESKALKGALAVPGIRPVVERKVVVR